MVNMRRTVFLFIGIKAVVMVLCLSLISISYIFGSQIPSSSTKDALFSPAVSPKEIRRTLTKANINRHTKGNNKGHTLLTYWAGKGSERHVRAILETSKKIK